MPKGKQKDTEVIEHLVLEDDESEQDQEKNADNHNPYDSMPKVDKTEEA